jgi:hypothetical protein
MTTANYTDAFERVLDQWLTLEERFPMALPGLAHEAVPHDEGGNAVTAEAVLQKLSTCPVPLPEHIKSRCPSFLSSGSYGELAVQMLDTMVRIEAVLRVHRSPARHMDAMMKKPYGDKRLWERPEYRNAFEQVIALWEELEKDGPLATLRLEKMRVLPEGEEPIPVIAVLTAFQDYHEPLPDRLRNKVTRYLDFHDCITYSDLVKFLAAVGDFLEAQEPSPGAKLN